MQELIPYALVAIILLLAGSTALQARQNSGSRPGAPVPPPRFPRKFGDLFDALASAHGVPARLMESIVSVESSFNPRAVNPETDADRRKGRDVDSIGLAQILFPDTAQAVRPGTTREELLDPAINLGIAFKLMAGLQRMWPGTDADGFPSQAVAAYNAGRPRLTDSGTFTNQPYVDRVHAAWRDRT